MSGAIGPVGGVGGIGGVGGVHNVRRAYGAYGAARRTAAADGGVEPGGFSSAVERAVARVDAVQKEADAAAQGLAAGEGEVHDTMLKLTQADLTFRVALEVRNRLLEGFREVWQTPV